MQKWDYCIIQGYWQLDLSYHEEYSDYIKLLTYDPNGQLDTTQRPVILPHEISGGEGNAQKVDGKKTDRQGLWAAYRENHLAYLKVKGQLIAELGMAGWEMVGFEDEGTTIYFRRPKANGS